MREGAKENAQLYLLQAEAYLRAATVVHNAELTKTSDPRDWEMKNPMFFLLLHATELALKAVAFARNEKAGLSHDIVKLANMVKRASDRKHVREIYKNLRKLDEQRIRDKWVGRDGVFSQAACEMELDKLRQKPVRMVSTFKFLGALGQSKMEKREFGDIVEKWWHAARYPRYGITSYPGFDACVVICEGIIEIAKQELSGPAP